MPLDGGALTYRSAESLGSPTWAPPDLGAILGAWPGIGAVWVQFEDSRLGRYDYSTGHLQSFEDEQSGADLALALEDGSGLVLGRGRRILELVGGTTDWRLDVGGRLVRLEGAGDNTLVAVVEHESDAELVVLEPSAGAPLARRRVSGVRDIEVTAWGSRLYYVSGAEGDTTVHGLSLPELEPVGALELPAAGQAVAATPSSHRIYVAAGRTLYAFERLSGRRIAEVGLPGSVASLRFGLTGANLIARMEGEDRVAVLQVGVDSVLGVIAADWGDRLPVALPGGRLMARHGSELVLYSLPSLAEIARVGVDERRVWLPVEWHPPRPRVELAFRDAAKSDAGSGARDVPAVVPIVEDTSLVTDPEAAAPPGIYAVVLAARAPGGVENLVAWLRSVGYPALRDRHEDVLGAVWYRAMVGPYATRSDAESSARSLSARYGYKPWILTIEPGEDSERPEAADSSRRENEPA